MIPFGLVWPQCVSIFVTGYSVQMGLDPNNKLTESDIYKSHLPEQIGLKWKDLARELGFIQSTIDVIEKEKLLKTKECCIELLVQWMRQNGSEATVGKLKQSLEKVELKNVADNLITSKQDLFLFSSIMLCKLDSHIVL